MAITDANKTPIYSIGGDNSVDSSTTMAPTFTTQAADYTGATATHNKLVFTAGANGSFVQRLRFKAIGTNTASVARIFINNGSSNTTATNNVFYGEISLPATTAIATAATVEIDYPMNFALTPNFRIYVGLGTTVAAGWVCFAVGGEY
jgi:hypothetical protein